MMRQTGGLAVGAISTRSSSAASALATASASVTMPSCSPSSPTSRISAALISPLIRCALSWAIAYSPSEKKRDRAPHAATLVTRRDLLAKAREQGVHGHRPQILAAAGTHGHLQSLHLLVADDQLVRQLLQAMFSNLIGNFLITQIRFDAQAGRPEP